MRFGRVLRAAGLPVGPADGLAAVEAVDAAGVANREDVRAALAASFLRKREHRHLFDQAFEAFWRNPRLLERMTKMLLPDIRKPPEEQERDEMALRLAEALRGATPPEQDAAPDEARVEFEATLTWSEQETLRQKDFEQMSADEQAQARKALARLRWPVAPRRTRRWRPDSRGTMVDLRASLRAGVRAGGADAIAKRARRMEEPPVVALVDISGSMSQYARMLLHFLHGVVRDRSRTHVFLFGTRLTNVTRALRNRDVDIALAACGQAAQDWEGGTRLGATLAAFNRDWGRRVLSGGATVLLVTDGLDREAGAGLDAAADRLAKSCRRLIWLNPLLRWDGYEAKATGAAILARHADALRGAHNVASIGELVGAVSREHA